MTDDLISRKAALAAIDPGHGDFHAGNYNAIAALPAVTVAVKQLLWLEGRAKTPFGDYFVYQDSPGMWCVNFEASHMVLDGIRVQPTEASAKAAAQADYDARIRAALEPPTHAAQLAAALALPEVAAMRTAGANWCAVWANRDYNDPSFPARHDRAYLDLIHALSALEARHDPE